MRKCTRPSPALRTASDGKLGGGLGTRLGRRPGECYHVIRGTGVTCGHAICIAMLARRPNLRSELATNTRQALTENNIKCRKHIRARRNSSVGLPNYMCEISAVTKKANVAEKQPLLDLQRLQQNHPSAVSLQTQVCSRSRTCLSAGSCLVSLASL